MTKSPDGAGRASGSVRRICSGWPGPSTAGRSCPRALVAALCGYMLANEAESVPGDLTELRARLSRLPLRLWFFLAVMGAGPALLSGHRSLDRRGVRGCAGWWRAISISAVPVAWEPGRVGRPVAGRQGGRTGRRGGRVQPCSGLVAGGIVARSPAPIRRNPTVRFDGLHFEASLLLHIAYVAVWYSGGAPRGCAALRRAGDVVTLAVFAGVRPLCRFLRPNYLPPPTCSSRLSGGSAGQVEAF